MQQPKSGARRVVRESVKPGIWKRRGADGRVRFEIIYRDSEGRQRQQVVEGGVRAAEAALADVKGRMGRGERVVPQPSLTFAEAAERFMESVDASLRPATRAAYRSSLETHLLPAWGRLRLDRIDVDAVARLIEAMQTVSYRAEVEARVAKRTRKPPTTGYAPWTIRAVLVPAGRVFAFAQRRLRWAGSNPVRELERSELPAHRQDERRILSRDELARLIDAARSPYREVIATAAGLGTRLGETLGLTWADVDLDEGTAAVCFQIDRRGQRVELKTKRSRRVIEMPGSVVSMLRAHKLASPYSRPGDLVFTRRGGGPLEHRNVAQRGLGKAVKAAGLEGRAPTFHELRHTHASAWIANGGDLVELSARLGHRDPAVTASVYSHEFEAAARSDQRRARLDAMYGADVSADVPAAGVSEAQQSDPAGGAEVRSLSEIRDVAQ